MNQCLIFTRGALEGARKRGPIAAGPDVEWLKKNRPRVDFLNFDKGDRLVAVVEGEWATMFFVAMRTGLRRGGLQALERDDVALVRCVVRVQRSAYWSKKRHRWFVGFPKSGKPREAAESRGLRGAREASRDRQPRAARVLAA